MLIANIIQEENFSSLVLKHTSEAGHKVMTVHWQLLKYIQLRQTITCRSKACMAKMDNPISIHMLCSNFIHTTAVQDRYNLTEDAVLMIHTFWMVTNHI
jgi:hypothetical protein